MTITAIIFWVAIYILSVIGAYKFHQLSFYHKHGNSVHMTPSTGDVMLTIVPMVNTVFALSYLTGGWKHEKYRKTNFFKPKNKDDDKK